MNLKLYIVVNQEGKYFRAKGRDGHGDSWITDIQKARIYTKLGPARSTVSFFSSKYPQYGVPLIHELTVSSTNVLDETKRVTEILEKKIKTEEKKSKLRLAHEILLAEKTATKAMENLKALINKKGTK